MKNTKSAVAILGLLAAAALAGPAAAQDKGIYLGGSVGYAQYKDSCKLLLIPCDDHDSAWRLFGGYRFSRAISAELGYADLGGATGEGTVGAGPASLKQTAKAWDLIGVFSLPIADRLSAFGKLGIYRARSTLDVATVASGPLHAGGTNSGLSPTAPAWATTSEDSACVPSGSATRTSAPTAPAKTISTCSALASSSGSDA